MSLLTSQAVENVNSIIEPSLIGKSYDDDRDLLFNLLHIVLRWELGHNIMEKIEHTRLCHRLYVYYMLNLLAIVTYPCYFSFNSMSIVYF
uniref:Uncharacterized protein n=1 Tax=Lactuca sativa TaxID=4236 RepID=A0A9R1XPW7_LACSA|nr:hypothetical protein LSAT_V11C300151240 [Lactuca sativa]